MADFHKMHQNTVESRDHLLDLGLRKYMLGVYNTMALGLAFTALSAMFFSFLAISTDPSQTVSVLRNGVALTSFGQAIYSSPLNLIIIFAPLAVVFALQLRISHLSIPTAKALFFLYALLIGFSLSSIFTVYTQQSIMQTFLITAAAFGALSIYGYTTKRDLSAFASFLVMGVFGLMIAMLVNVFLGSGPLQLLISILGVGIFAGLTAYHTQDIKLMYYKGDDTLLMGRKSILGALTLYISFINMFVFLIQIFGNRRD